MYSYSRTRSIERALNVILPAFRGKWGYLFFGSAPKSTTARLCVAVNLAHLCGPFFRNVATWSLRYVSGVFSNLQGAHGSRFRFAKDTTLRCRDHNRPLLTNFKAPVVPSSSIADDFNKINSDHSSYERYMKISLYLKSTG